MTDQPSAPSAEVSATPTEAPVVETPSEGVGEVTAESIISKFKDEKPWDAPDDGFEEEGETAKETAEEAKTEETEEETEAVDDTDYETAFLGDKTFDVPLDAEITIKVGGKLESVKISELKNNWSGKVHYDRKFSDLANREKVFQDQVRKADNILEGFFKAAEESPVLALTFQDTAKGMPIKQSLKKRFLEMAEHVAKYAKMDEGQRDDYLDRIAFQKERQEFEIQRKKKDETDHLSKAQEHLNTQLDKNGYTMQDYDLAIEEMTQAVTNNLIDAPKTAEELVKKAVDWIGASKLYSKISSIGHKASASTDDINFVFKQAQELGASLTDLDIKEIFESIPSDTKATKTHKADVKSKPTMATPKGKASASQTSKSEEVDEEAMAIARNLLSIAY